MGRIGFYRGQMGPVGVVNAVLTAVARDSGASALIDPGLVSKFPLTLAPQLATYERIEMDYQTGEDGVALRSIEIVLRHAEILAEGLIEPDGTFAGWGVVALSTHLTSDLIGRVPALARLPGSDGRLRVPVKLQGGPAATAVTVDEGFVDALRKAMRGEPVGSFVATEPASELVMDMPSLREQFNRW